MRIVSLVPHATELIFALDLGPELVGVTHECDFPPPALDLPNVTRDLLPVDLGAAEIDAAVRERTQAGEAIYELDRDALAELEPDVIVTQALCPVCAVSYDEVAELAATLPSHPEVIALDPHTLGEVLGDIGTLAVATETKDRAVGLVRELADRIDGVRLAVRRLERPRVAALEWLDPVFAAGHWVPQLIEFAGGEDTLAKPGEPSPQLTWGEVAASTPEVLIAMPCGYDAERSAREAIDYADELTRVGAQVFAVDAAGYFSRPGPRLVDGLELLAHILHSQQIPAPPTATGPIAIELG